MDYLRCALAILLLFHAKTIDTTYRLSRMSTTWSDAQKHCQTFGGRLATLENLADLRTWMNAGFISNILEDDSELWVGARRQQSKWAWLGEEPRDFTGTLHFYENAGCHHQQYWRGGTRLDKPTPVQCFQHCSWQGHVGLKKDYCMCEDELHNVSSIHDAICHIPCESDASKMCGGYLGVSLYQPATFSVQWAPDEPRSDNDCAVLRKCSRDSPPELMSANCDMQTRYVCSFKDDVRCGVMDACFRSSSGQFTWSDAASKCNLTTFHDGHIDEASELQSLGPGTYWLGLRRNTSWVWLSDKQVKLADFLPHQTGMFSDARGLCAVIRRSGNHIGLSAGICSHRKHYLCQYDFMDRMQDDSPAAPPSTEVYNITTATSTTPSTTQVTGDVMTSSAAQPGPSSILRTGDTISICLYMVGGFLSGMVLVLILAWIFYSIYRCSRPDASKHTRLGSSTASGIERSHSVIYSQKDDTVRIAPPSSTGTPPSSDITYDTVYDLQAESPFRTSQRLIQAGSANSWRHPQSRESRDARRPRADTADSTDSAHDYMWRGMISGQVEILNTELRSTGQSKGAQDGDNYAIRQVYSISRGEIPATLPRTLHTQCDVHADSACSVGHYDDNTHKPPVRAHRRTTSSGRNTYPANGAKQLAYDQRPSIDSHSVNDPRNKRFKVHSLPRDTVTAISSDQITTEPDMTQPHLATQQPLTDESKRFVRLSQNMRDESSSKRQGVHEDSFLELRAARNSGSEENIYATVKKTFKRLEDEMNKQTHQAAESEDDHMMYNVKLTDL